MPALKSSLRSAFGRAALALLLLAFPAACSSARASGDPNASSDPAALSAGPALRFDTEEAAQRHCPHDTVVWVNTKTGVYHLKGERWYGATRQGAYMCRREADAEGDRMTRNGQ